ncbi:MAG: GTPase Era [Arenicellales bacterium]|jgi:GTP-binding protein Era|nr:GTPase Era [Arenicellales bacterium]
MSASGRFGIVALVGRPNVGKSTLLNRLVESKVSITSRRPQTTWHRVEGIRTVGDTQLVFLDTPGLHESGKRTLNRVINQTARGAVTGVNIICLVTDARGWRAGDARVLELVKTARTPVWLVMNKADRLQAVDQLLPNIDAVRGRYRWDQVVPISAKTGYNTAHLLDLLDQSVPVGRPEYPIGEVTTLPRRFMAAELIREQLFRRLGAEIPYTTGVTVSDFTTGTDGPVTVSAEILCETAGQKRAIIGEKGRKLKIIGISARRELERLLGQQVFLEQRVKVRKGWTDDLAMVNRLGYALQD